MTVQFRPLTRRGASQTIADRLREQILAGRIPPGELLPTERDLAAAFGVNRLTVRQAIARLESLGLVRAFHGSGTRVLDFRRTAGIHLLTDLMTARRRDRSLSVELLRDLLEVRRALAAEIVALAAERSTPGDVEDLRALAVEQEGRVHDRAAFVKGDLAFLRRLVQTCRNLAVELLFNSVAAFLEAHADVARAMFEDPTVVAPQYRAVLMLIESRQGRAAADLVRRILEELDRATLERFERRVPRRGPGDGPEEEHEEEQP